MLSDCISRIKEYGRKPVGCGILAGLSIKYCITCAVLAEMATPEDIDPEYFTRTKSVELNTDVQLDEGQSILVTDHETGEELYDGSSDSFMISSLDVGENAVDIQLVDEIAGETVSSQPLETVIEYDNAAPQLTFEYELVNLEKEATNYATEENPGIDNSNEEVEYPDYELADPVEENIEIDEPDPDQEETYWDESDFEFSEDANVYCISGKVDKYAEVCINGQMVDVEANEDGTCSYGYEFKPTRGANLIAVSAADLYGNVTLRMFVVNY